MHPITVLLMCFMALCALHSTRAAAKIDTCYKCNSEIDKDCLTFDKAKFAKFAVACQQDRASHDYAYYVDTPAKGCRKMEQFVTFVKGEKARVVRECAFGGKALASLRRTGNRGVHVTYYQCESKDNCNSGQRYVSSVLMIALTFIFVAIFK